jgi:hypothetical protein
MKRIEECPKGKRYFYFVKPGPNPSWEHGIIDATQERHA